jgi:ELWxxDGT repeat protein
MLAVLGLNYRMYKLDKKTGLGHINRRHQPTLVTILIMSRYPAFLRSAGMAVFAALACWLLPVRAAVFTSQLVTNLPVVTGLPFDSSPTAGAYLGGYLYFAATDGPEGTNGLELWRTDGTTAGTTLVKDINPGAGDSSPTYIIACETNLFFLASDGVHGQCLWKSDGTAVGTTLVFNPQIPPGSSPIISLSACGNGAVLSISYYTSGGGFSFNVNTTTYRSDGTPGGTFILAGPGGVITTNQPSTFYINGYDIAVVTYATGVGFDHNQTNTLWHFGGAGPYFDYSVFTSTNPINSPAIIGTNCYFITPTNYTVTTSSTTNTYAFERLFRTSFVSSGVPAVVDSSPVTYSSSFIPSGVYNSRMFYSTVSKTYSGDTTANGPWKSVGQTGSPSTIEPDGSGGQYVLGVVSPYVYYDDANQLRRTDGVSAGVTVVNFTSLGIQAENFQQAGSKFYFSTSIPQGLGITDLTPGGTHMITNALPATNAFFNNFVGNVGATLIYGVQNPLLGLEPYRTDGTGPGTSLLKDIAQGHAVAAPLEAATIGGLELFTMDSPGNGVELWRSDGTAAGTFLLKDIRAGTNSSNASHLTALNGIVYFSADDGVSGPELWRSDGTAAGTYLLKDIRVGAAGSNPSQFVTAGSYLFFVANDGSHGAELWQSDGTPAGTVMSQDIVPGFADGNIRALGAVGTNVYFFAGSSNTAGQFWIGNAQPGGTQFIKDLGSMSAAQLPTNYTAFNGKVYFPVLISSPFSPYIIYVTDNTPNGTGPSIAGGPSVSTVAGNLVYIGTNNLYLSDGVNTTLLTNIPSAFTPQNFQTFGSLLYFTVGSDLWRTDGTTNGTIPVAQFSAPEPTTPAPAQLTQYQNALLFTGWAPTLGRELWTTSPGQGLSLVEDLYPQSGDPQDLLVRAATNQVFYFARVPGQDAWQLRSLHQQSPADPAPVPYGGTAWAVPGVIEAENFDVGSDGAAYYDLTADNEGGVYRPKDGVDIQPCNDTGGGYCVYQTRAGEWLDYTIQVATSGNYQLDVRLTSSVADYGYFHFEVDGAGYYEFATLNDGTPGGWYTESGTILLPAGRHTLRLVGESNTSAGDVGIFNWFNLTLLQTNAPPIVSITFPPAGGIISTNETKGLIASASDSTTDGALPVEFFVDGQSVGISSNQTPQVAWTPTLGSHTVYARATDSFGVSANSSNVVFFVAEPVLASPSFWRVNAFGTNVPTAWRQTVYDDSKWVRLHSPLGFGYPGVTLMPSNFNGSPIPTYYFRQAISNDLSTFNTASITLTRDDGAIVYINGQSLARINLPQPPTNVLFTTLASTNVFSATAAEDVIPVPLSMLVNGTNEIAVEIHQAPVFRDFDIKFDLTFSTFNYVPSPQLTVQVLGGRNLSIQWPDTSIGWTPQQSQDLVHWTDLTNSVTDTNGTFYLNLGTSNFTHDFFRLRH